MSEKSFAIASISAAIICGTFFYPPPPADPVPAPVPPHQAIHPVPIKLANPAHPRGEVQSQERAVEQLAKLGSVASPFLHGFAQRLNAGK